MMNISLDKLNVGSSVKRSRITKMSLIYLGNLSLVWTYILMNIYIKQTIQMMIILYSFIQTFKQ